MTSNIILKGQNNDKKRLYSESDSIYSLVDKPYYVEAMLYKVDK